MPHNFYNIDSRVKPSKEEQLYSITGSWVHALTHDIRVYLVSRDTMDKISPRERSIGIPVESLREVRNILSGFFEKATLEKDDIDRVIDSIFEKLGRFSKKHSLLGVFIAPTSSRTIEAQGKSIELPAIILCVERILEEAKNVSKESGGLGLGENKAFKLLLRKVLAHEQAHALSWKMSEGKTYDKHKEIHVRIIEETLAQLVAYNNPPKRANDKREYEYVMLALTNRQPVEYSIWKILTPLLKGGLDVLGYMHTYIATVTAQSRAILPYLFTLPLQYPLPLLYLPLLYPPLLYLLERPIVRRLFYYIEDFYYIIRKKPEYLLKMHALALLYMYTTATYK